MGHIQCVVFCAVVNTSESLGVNRVSRLVFIVSVHELIITFDQYREVTLTVSDGWVRRFWLLCMWLFSQPFWPLFGHNSFSSAFQIKKPCSEDFTSHRRHTSLCTKLTLYLDIKKKKKGQMYYWFWIPKSQINTISHSYCIGSAKLAKYISP